MDLEFLFFGFDPMLGCSHCTLAIGSMLPFAKIVFSISSSRGGSVDSEVPLLRFDNLPLS